MKNGMGTWTAAIGALLLAGALTGCGNGASGVQSVAKATPTSYPAPDVQIVAQPVLASYNQKALSRSSDEYSNTADQTYSSHRHRRSHAHHKKAAQDIATGADPDMGLMAADDPKLLQAEIAAKGSHKEDWKQWAAPAQKAPEGR